MNLRENIKKELRLLNKQTRGAKPRVQTKGNIEWDGAYVDDNNPERVMFEGYTNEHYVSPGFSPPGGIPVYAFTAEHCNGSGWMSTSGGVVVDTSQGTWPDIFLNSQPPQVGDEIANYTSPNQYQGTITSVTPITHTGGASISAKFLGTSPCNTSTGCDTTPNSPCAQQWFQNPNANWAANWITNRDCSNYTWPANNLPVQALQLMSSAPNPQPGPYNNASDIWSKANAAWTTGGPGSPKNQFIGKMAKGRYAECQKAACNC